MTHSSVLQFETPPIPIRHTRTGFERIPRDLSKAELLRYFTYSPEDRDEIFQCRGNSNKVGFALLLSGIRLTGRFPSGFELLGTSLISHVCNQLGLEKMLFLDYPQRQPTRYEHAERLKRYLGLRGFVASDQNLVAEFVRQQIQTGVSPDEIPSQSEEYLREQMIVLPGVTVLKKLVTASTLKAEGELYDLLQQRMTPDMRVNILQLLVISKGETLTPFQKLQQTAGRPSPDALIRELNHLNQVRSLIHDTFDFSGISQPLIERWARLTAALPTRSLQRFSESKRTALLFCWLWHLRTQVIDTSLTVANDLIAGVLRRDNIRWKKPDNNNYDEWRQL